MDIETRLRRLERTNRFLLLLLIIAIGIAWYSAWTANSHVSAAQHPANIVANSIETRSLSVVNPTGKQGLYVSVGDDGIVTLLITDAKGEETIGLGSVNTVGEPSICLAYRNVCRVVIGDVYRGNQREFSVQLRDKDGNPVWMPATENPVAAAPRGSSRKQHLR